MQLVFDRNRIFIYIAVTKHFTQLSSDQQITSPTKSNRKVMNIQGSDHKIFLSLLTKLKQFLRSRILRNNVEDNEEKLSVKFKPAALTTYVIPIAKKPIEQTTEQCPLPWKLLHNKAK